MLNDVEAAHQIERIVGEGQAGDIAEYGLRAEPPQFCDRRRAYIQEPGARDRKSRP